VREGIQSKPPWGDLKNQIYLGTEDFVNDTQEKIDASKKLLDIPYEQYTPVKKSLSEYDKQKTRPDPIDYVHLPF